MVSPIVIGGPTGSGKSDYALKLAQQINGEIVCADSRQVYAGMQIGSASATLEERTLVPHHGYNVINPHETYDAGRFVEDTDKTVQEILSRQKTPILVGGTGMYLRSWRFGLSDVPEKNPELRIELREALKKEGLEVLYQNLKAIDPESAQKIGEKDEFRILRALEIFRLTGQKPSTLRKSHFDEPRQDAQWLLLKPEREWLNARLELRTKKMFTHGLVEEAIALRNFLPKEHALLQTMGYRESLNYVDGAIDLNSAIELTFIRTRQYAKRQVSWFAKENWWSVI